MKRFTLTSRLLGVAALLIGACSSEGSEPRATPTPAAEDGGLADGAFDAAVDAPASATAFGLCPAGYSGACALIDVPLDHGATGGKTIKVLVNRLATTSKATAQLWMLQGGPGGSAADLNELGLTLAKSLVGFDIYTFEHRGVGASERLYCKEPAWTNPTKDEVDAFWKKCADDMSAKWPDGGLQKFSTTQAALDLGVAIDMVRKPGQKVFVYGVSYGTYWAQRYLQVRGEQPDGVVLDSIVSPGVQFMSKFDEQFELVAKKLAELCKGDAFCKTKLGDEPWARVQTLVTSLRTKTCVGAPPPEFAMSAFKTMLMQWGLNAIAFSVLHRYDRCAANDIAALKRLEEVLAAGNPAANPRFSQVLHFNVKYSELWETPPPTEAVLKARAESLVLGGEIFKEQALESYWPKYPRDMYVGAFPVTKKPVLVLNGDLDAQTTIVTASAAKSVYTAPGQAFIELPGANHGVIAQSPVPGQPPCGEQIITAWLKSPSSTPPTDCIARMAKLSFEGDEGMINFIYGRSSAWDEATTPSTPSAFKWSPERIERAVERLREAFREIARR